MSRVDSNEDVPELFDGFVKFIKEGGALLQDNAGTGRTEPVQLFLFNTCLLICRRSDKVGKWDLRVLMRMNNAVRVDPKGGLLFSVTAKGRTFSFGCLEQNEVAQWTKALNQAIDDTSSDSSTTATEKEDTKIGGLLLGLKGALGGGDDEPLDDEPLHRHTSTTTKSAPAPAVAAAAAAADDDDPFAAIARRPSQQSKPAAVTAASLDLFATAPQPTQPALSAPQVAAPTSAGGALSNDALMRLYAQSAAPAAAPVPMAPALHPTGPNYNIAFGGGSPAATTFAAQPPAAALFAQQPFGQGQPQQQFYQPQQPQQQPLFAMPPQGGGAPPQQQAPSKVDPFASLL